MGRFLARLPLLVVMIGVSGLVMLVPASFASLTEDFESARSFLYSSILILIATLIIGFATQVTTPLRTARPHLTGVIIAYLVLPAILAIPLLDIVGNTRIVNAYFEMVSCLTTTGATIYEAARLPDAVHLYRAIVGWMGGFMILVTALAILAPLNMGGFEVTSEMRSVVSHPNASQIQAAGPGQRLRRSARRIFPVYFGLTVVLSLLLAIAGEPPLIAAIHAMGVMSTSAISSEVSLSAGNSGFLGEAFILIFFFFALTRRSMQVVQGRVTGSYWIQDREMRLAIYVTLTITLLFFARHWLAALEVETADNAARAFASLWGGLFTILSFITTTGYVSEFWGEARSWSGLPTPGLLLVSLALMGGGVATTAGGIKLLRVYALYKHGARELSKLTYPNSVAPGGRMGRRIRREGAYIAWVFFMLFILSLAAISVALSATGLNFEESFVLATASLTTTGPLAAFGGGQPILYADLSDATKSILALAMVLGRLETLVLVAILNPSFWRN